MNSSSLVSIVVPCLNGEKTIARCIDSVVNQTYGDWELIIVDDGSIDKSIEIVQSYQLNNSNIFLLEKGSVKHGAALSRNLGLEFCKGELVIFLDCDDELLTNCISGRVSEMNKFKLDFCVFPQLYIFEDGKKIVSNLNCKIEELIRLFCVLDFPWQTTGPIWRKSFLKGLGGFDIDYLRMEDPDLHLRAIHTSSNFKIHSTAEPDSIYYCEYRYNLNLARSAMIDLMRYSKLLKSMKIDLNGEYFNNNFRNVSLNFLYYYAEDLNDEFHEIDAALLLLNFQLRFPNKLLLFAMKNMSVYSWIPSLKGFIFRLLKNTCIL